MAALEQPPAAVIASSAGNSALTSVNNPALPRANLYKNDPAAKLQSLVSSNCWLDHFFAPLNEAKLAGTKLELNTWLELRSKLVSMSRPGVREQAYNPDLNSIHWLLDERSVLQTPGGLTNILSHSVSSPSFRDQTIEWLYGYRSLLHGPTVSSDAQRADLSSAMITASNRSISISEQQISRWIAQFACVPGTQQLWSKLALRGVPVAVDMLALMPGDRGIPQLKDLLLSKDLPPAQECETIRSLINCGASGRELFKLVQGTTPRTTDAVTLRLLLLGSDQTRDWSPSHSNSAGNTNPRKVIAQVPSDPAVLGVQESLKILKLLQTGGTVWPNSNGGVELTESQLAQLIYACGISAAPRRISYLYYASKGNPKLNRACANAIKFLAEDCPNQYKFLYDRIELERKQAGALQKVERSQMSFLDSFRLWWVSSGK